MVLWFLTDLIVSVTCFVYLIIYSLFPMHLVEFCLDTPISPVQAGVKRLVIFEDFILNFVLLQIENAEQTRAMENHISIFCSLLVTTGKLSPYTRLWSDDA